MATYSVLTYSSDTYYKKKLQTQKVYPIRDPLVLSEKYLFLLTHRANIILFHLDLCFTGQ